MDSVIHLIVDSFSGKIPGELIIFIISMIPILELRGSILAAGFMNVSFLPTYIVAVIGNLLPIPFILIFIKKILDWMKTTKAFGKLATVIFCILLYFPGCNFTNDSQNRDNTQKTPNMQI